MNMQQQTMPSKPKSTMKKKKMISLSASSSTPPPPLPSDVIVEILSWVSVSSLMRFRWACKYWFDLITRDHAAFSKLHTLHQHQHEDINNSNNNTSLLIFNKFINLDSQLAYNMKCIDVLHQSSSSPKTELKIDFYSLLPAIVPYHIHSRSEFLGSCNGLIYFHQYFCPTVFNDKYFLWNPSRRELKQLPNEPRSNIACTSSSSSSTPGLYDYYDDDPNLKFIHGFGYDHTIQDYKVIRITYRCDDTVNGYVPAINSKQVVNNVYTLGSNSWHTKNETVPFFRDDWIRNNRSGLFANGALHWMIFPHMYYGPELVKIITFDITREQHGEIQCPKDISGTYSELTVLNGCLWVFDKNPHDVDVWIMKDYKEESWTKIFTINLQTLREFSPWSMKPVKYLKDSGILMLYDNECLAAYDTKNNKVRYVQKIEDAWPSFPFQHTCAVVTCVETLVSLNSGWILAPDGSRTATVVQIQE